MIINILILDLDMRMIKLRKNEGWKKRKKKFVVPYERRKLTKLENYQPSEETMQKARQNK